MRSSLLRLGSVALIALIAAPDRSIIAAEQPGGNDRGLSFSANTLESQNNLSSTLSTSSSDNARVAAQRVLVLHQKGHPLLDRVAAQLTTGLSACPFIAEVDSKSTDPIESPALAEGSRAPDLFLTLEMPRLKESGWVTRSLETVVLASLGSTPWDSHHSIADDTTPPLVQFHWNGRLDHKSTLKGIGSPRNRRVTDDIAKELGHSLSNALVKLAADHGTLPTLPDYLYGPYRRVPRPAFLETVQARQAFSYHGLLTHNETFWTFQLSSNAVPRLQAIVEQLTAEQWKPETVLLTNTMSYFVRAQRGDLRLEVFNPKPLGLGAHPDEQASPTVQFVAHVREPFSRAEREAAWDRLLNEDTSIETVLLFSRFYSGPQRQRFSERLEMPRLASPMGFLSLARARLDQKNTNAAVNALIKAQALLVTLREQGSAASQIQALSKEINESLDLTVTADTYRQLGFLEITNAPQSLSAQTGPGEPLRLFSTSDASQLRTLCLWVNTPSARQQPVLFSWTAIQTEGHGRSIISSSFDLNGRSSTTISLSQQPYSLKIRVTPAESAFRYEVGVEN